MARESIGAASASASDQRDGTIDFDNKSVVTAASAGGTPASPKTLSEKMSRYRKHLEPWAVMKDPKQSGRLLWQAGQTLAALKRKDSRGYETLALHALVEEAKLAHMLCIGKVEALSNKKGWR